METTGPSDQHHVHKWRRGAHRSPGPTAGLLEKMARSGCRRSHGDHLNPRSAPSAGRPRLKAHFLKQQYELLLPLTGGAPVVGHGAVVALAWPVLGRSEKIIIFSNLSGRPARHGSTSEKHYLCDQLPSATRGAGVDTDGPKFERRGLAVQIRGRRSPDRPI